jgi:serine protein kinase
MNKEFKESLMAADETHVDMEIKSYEEYLDILKDRPWVARNMTQLMHDMIVSSGVKHKISPGKPVKHHYEFFEDKKLIGNSVVFGQQKAKENIVEKISNASMGKEASKRLWILLGPTGSAKSLSMNGVKNALKEYSKSDKGVNYILMLPTKDKRLFGKCEFEENGIHYMPAPCFEKPLQVVPEHLRKVFIEGINKEVNKEAMVDFFEENPHYDKHFEISITGAMSPASNYILKDFKKAQGVNSFADLIPYLKVKRMIFDADTKTGIGSYTPRDEKSQEAGSLVGNIDYSLLPQFGSESHPLVHDYQGELCVGANGFVEIHEILKLSDKFLYELLFATQDRFFKPEGQAPIPFNGVIIGHTNFHEYNMFMSNPAFEALRSRTVIIEMPFSTDFKEEERIYENVYSNEVRNWSKEKRHTAHVAPHTFELLSLVSSMSRLYDSKKNKDLTRLQKALIYAGRNDSGVDTNMAEMVLEEFEYTKPSEGTFGLDPRFNQNVFEATEHKQIQEYLANIDRLNKEGGDQSLMSSIALENPCVTPLDLFLQLKASIKEIFAQKKQELSVLTEKILPAAEKWIQAQIASDVYSAILKDDSVVQSTWKKYSDHVRAYARNKTVKHEVTHEDIQPDEKFMSSIEAYMGINNKDTFRKELSDGLASAESVSEVLDHDPSYKAAIKRFVFENEFKSGENAKLLGWIKSSSSVADETSQEQEHFNDTVKYLIDNLGYCGKCAHQALVVTANANSVIS